jgi:glycerol-3-phosphate cytidylyltransferase-like family protein
MTKDKTVITYGTFDISRMGHLQLLQQLKAMGNWRYKFEELSTL